MADLITHASVNLLLKAAERRPEHVALFVYAGLLPDVVSRIPGLVATWVHSHLHPLPAMVLYASEPLHQPIGMALVAYVVAMFFPFAERAAVFRNLLGGMLLHLAVDLFQRHVGAGYALFFPFSTAQFELGWMGSEATVPAAPFLALGALMAWRWRAHRLAG